MTKEELETAINKIKKQVSSNLTCQTTCEYLLAISQGYQTILLLEKELKKAKK